VIVQTLLGEFAHQIMARKGVRTGYVHAVIGVTTFGLSIWEIQLGLDLWSWNPSNGVSIFVSQARDGCGDGERRANHQDILQV